MLKLTCEGVVQERLTALEGKINEALADRFSAMMSAMRDEFGTGSNYRHYVEGNFDPGPRHVNCRCIIIPNDDPNIIDADWEVMPNKLQLPERKEDDS